MGRIRREVVAHLLTALFLSLATAALASSPEKSTFPLLEKPHFHFLPPLTEEPASTGDFDPLLEPIVDVFDWANGSIGGRLARFELGEGRDGIHVDAADSAYVCVWSAGRSTAHRDSVAIRVSMYGELVGQMVILVNPARRSFPIKFRPEWGLFALPGTDQGQIDEPLPPAIVDSIESYQVPLNELTPSPWNPGIGKLAPRLSQAGLEDVITLAYGEALKDFGDGTTKGTPYGFNEKNPLAKTYQLCWVQQGKEWVPIYVCDCQPHVQYQVDCSGLVTWAFSSVFSDGVPHKNADGLSDQDNWSIPGLPAAAVDPNPEALQRGDLLFFDWTGNGIIDHVGFYLGLGRYVSANGHPECPLNVREKRRVSVKTVHGHLVRVLRFGAPLADLSTFPDVSCNISSTCPEPGCLRAGRDYFVELSLKDGVLQPPPGTTVLFRVNGKQLGEPVALSQRYADSDRPFLSVPFRPAASERTLLEADIRTPGMLTRTISHNVAVIFDSQVLVKHGRWHVQSSQTKTKTVADVGAAVHSTIEGTLDNELCRFTGDVQVLALGTATVFGTTCTIPPYSNTCGAGDCVNIDLRRTAVTFEGTVSMPLGPCSSNRVTSLGSNMLLPPNFSFDLTSPGTQVIDGATVTVAFVGAYGAPQIQFVKSWDIPDGLGSRETGQATVEFTRVDTPESAIQSPRAAGSVIRVADETDIRATEPLARLAEARPRRSTPRLIARTRVVSVPSGTGVRFEIELQHAGVSRLFVYDSRGRLIRRLAGEWRSAGRHEISWDGHSQDGRHVANGIYFVRLEGRDGEGAAAKFVWLR